MRYADLLLGAWLLVIAGCGLLGSSEENAVEAPIVTGQETFQATVTSSRVEVTVPYIFRNRADRPVYVPVCDGPHPPRLEKRVEGVWIEVYAPNVPLCQGPPLVIEPGGAHRSRLGVELVRSANFHPYLQPGDVPGTYRLVWGVFAEKDGRDLSGLLPQEERISNTFIITV